MGRVAISGGDPFWFPGHAVDDALAVDDQHIYWYDPAGEGAIRRAPKGGGPTEDLVVNHFGNCVHALAVDATHVARRALELVADGYETVSRVAHRQHRPVTGRQRPEPHLQVQGAVVVVTWIGTTQLREPQSRIVLDAVVLVIEELQPLDLDGAALLAVDVLGPPASVAGVHAPAAVDHAAPSCVAYEGQFGDVPLRGLAAVPLPGEADAFRDSLFGVDISADETLGRLEDAAPDHGLEPGPGVDDGLR